MFIIVSHCTLASNSHSLRACSGWLERWEKYALRCDITIHTMIEKIECKYLFRQRESKQCDAMWCMRLIKNTHTSNINRNKHWVWFTHVGWAFAFFFLSLARSLLSSSNHNSLLNHNFFSPALYNRTSSYARSLRFLYFHSFPFGFFSYSIMHFVPLQPLIAQFYWDSLTFILFVNMLSMSLLLPLLPPSSSLLSRAVPYLIFQI